ncbi:hypothetical protein RRG08_054402 [Elysia crispata]|uniref:Uncharacterized protein n=1 Tax=Elysia crispata TaxID=231223 RepID=A0AAE1E9J1_9GAST|nr:hypothetical protein RRG08_054402 [Elysia crispata]
MEQNPLAGRKPKHAANILDNSLGSCVKNIKRYSAFEGKISHNEIKPSILNAIRRSMKSNPKGARGHFFFWGNQSAKTGSRRKRSATVTGRGRKAASLGNKRRNAKTDGTNNKRNGAGSKCKSQSKRKKSKEAKDRNGRKRKRLRLSEIMKYSGMKLKNGRRLIVFTTKD